ncbi:hypothetical protein L1987_15929 [Smallanthus sonchifolius]|uniref:Uncharacterized protein n=1 Tax=Smallanthus sonchifolius TaxID=185202 RepID=A0ACB9J920_9ASTR|nr:hypothetical protein L1987_15929 [Smallanthus sonchifolius]
MNAPPFPFQTSKLASTIFDLCTFKLQSVHGFCFCSKMWDGDGGGFEQLRGSFKRGGGGSFLIQRQSVVAERDEMGRFFVHHLLGSCCFRKSHKRDTPRMETSVWLIVLELHCITSKSISPSQLRPPVLRSAIFLGLI